MQGKRFIKFAIKKSSRPKLVIIYNDENVRNFLELKDNFIRIFQKNANLKFYFVIR